jgi:rSAM/selenodomain-associated transferase 2
MIIHAAVPDYPLSVVIPTLNEAATLQCVLSGLEGQAGGPPIEVILADGGSMDGTVERFGVLTKDWAARGWRTGVEVTARTGRGIQMNAGAGVARGEALLFLHADTRLPGGAIREIVETLHDPSVVGGGFRLKYEEPGLPLRLIGGYATLRSRLRGVHYGDQAMFLRTCVFRSLGGFPEVPLFEDLRLSLELRRAGRVVTVPMEVVTSARRLRQGGIGRTAARFAWLKMLHALGIDPARLKGGYPDVR